MHAVQRAFMKKKINEQNELVLKYYPNIFLYSADSLYTKTNQLLR